MLTLEHFLTREGLVDLFSVATYGNCWPLISVYKSDYEKGLGFRSGSSSAES